MIKVTPRAAGFSLIELMVGITIGLVLLAGVANLFANSSRSRAELDRTTRQIETGRFALEYIGEDIRLAGFFGELDVSGLTKPTAMPDPCSTTASDWAAALPVHLQGYDGGTGLPSCLPSTSVVSGTDVIVVRRARSCTAGSTGCDAATAGFPYVQVSLCATETGTHTVGLQGSTSFALKAKDCTSAANLRQYMVTFFYVSPDNGAGVSVPTLKQRTLNGSGFTETALIEGVQNVQYEYGIDTTGDGAADVYTANPTTYACTGCTAVSNWMNVVSVRMHVLARSTDIAVGYTDSKTYTMGLDASGAANAVGPFSDNYRRFITSTLFRINNVAGRRDVP